jgi:hypothetical protein
MINNFETYKPDSQIQGFMALDISIVTNPQRMFLVADSDQAIETEIKAL